MVAILVYDRMHNFSFALFITDHDGLVALYFGFGLMKTKFLSFFNQIVWTFHFQIECIDVCGKNVYIGTNDWWVK